MTDDEREKLGNLLLDLSQRLGDLDVRIAEDDDDSRRSLSEAFHAFNGLARILAPDLVVPEDLDDLDDRYAGDTDCH